MRLRSVMSRTIAERNSMAPSAPRCATATTDTGTSRPSRARSTASPVQSPSRIKVGQISSWTTGRSRSGARPAIGWPSASSAASPSSAWPAALRYCRRPEAPQRDLALEREPLGEVRRHLEPERLGCAILDALPGDRPEHAGFEQPQHARFGLDELAGRVHDPPQYLVEILRGDERLRQIVEDRETVLLVGQTALRQDVFDRRRQLGEIALALDEVVRDAELERLNGRVLVALAGDHHDGNTDAVGLQPLEHLDPREIGHPVVEQQHVVVFGLQLGERLPREGDRLDTRATVVVLEGAQGERHVLRMVLGIEEADRL